MDDAIDLTQLREYCLLLEQASALLVSQKTIETQPANISLHIKANSMIEKPVIQSLVNTCQKAGVGIHYHAN